MVPILSFHGFWKNSAPAEFFFQSLFQEAALGAATDSCYDQKKGAIEVHSVFQFKNLIHKVLFYSLGKLDDRAWTRYLNRSKFGFSERDPKNSSIRVWFTGENLRPPVGEYDLFLSFDANDSAINNIYFPIWYLNLDWNFHGFDRPLWNIETFLSARDLGDRPKNSCIFSSYKDPHRTRLILAVESVMPVAKFGHAWANKVSNKQEVSSSFGFQICPENDMYPGYVTEKVFEAYLAGNIPIWTGLDREHVFNPKAMIDLTNCTTNEASELLASLTASDIQEMRNQPLLLKRPDIAPAISAIRDLLVSRE